MYRSRGLFLCEWAYENERELTTLLNDLESGGQFTRAAMMAVFNLNVRRAIQSLTTGAAAPLDQGGDLSYYTVAMALAGFNDKSSLWKETCRGLCKQLTDCHLKAIFAFLTCDNNDYSEILVSGMRSIRNYPALRQ